MPDMLHELLLQIRQPFTLMPNKPACKAILVAATILISEWISRLECVRRVGGDNISACDLPHTGRFP
jgi:hypothetical protein